MKPENQAKALEAIKRLLPHVPFGANEEADEAIKFAVSVLKDEGVQVNYDEATNSWLIAAK